MARSEPQNETWIIQNIPRLKPHDSETSGTVFLGHTVVKLQIGTCKIVNLAVNPRWSRVWQKEAEIFRIIILV